jgi:SAM-dependent methyltransferase
VTERYWFDNSLSDEGTRLRLLEKIADPRSISLLNGLGVGPGSTCAELGAGGGSMAAWLADRVGDAGSVLAVDRNLSLCRHLAERPNVELLEAELETLELEPATYDLVHTRNVLMHLDDADQIIARVVGALRPGGRLLLEEADYFALAGITSAVFASSRSSTSRSRSMRPCSTAPRTKPPSGRTRSSRPGIGSRDHQQEHRTAVPSRQTRSNKSRHCWPIRPSGPRLPR